MTITESKLDRSFTATQVLLDIYPKSFRFERSRNGIGGLLYVRENMACRKSKIANFRNDIEGTFIKLNLRKVYWLLFQDIILILNLITAISFTLAIVWTL